MSSSNLQKWYDSLNQLITELVNKGESRDVYEYLIGANIFPKAKVLEERVDSPTMQIFNVVNFDINLNVSGRESKGVSPYFLYVLNLSIRHLWLVFTKGVKTEKISFNSLKDYLQNHTWYGDKISYQSSDGEIEYFSWLDLLLPAFHSYFIQSHIDIKMNKNNQAGYILCIDSLVLKFEGVLREFSRRIGAQTIEIKQDGTEARISFEKLFKNERFIKAVPEDNVALFRFLFTKEGMDLRNNIAHCFYKPDNYSASIMWLLICAFLRLGNYSFKPVSGRGVNAE